VLDAVGTAAALESLVERVRTRANMTINLQIDLAREAGRTPERHPPALEDTIYRVVQEALTNIVKHACATTAAVTIAEVDGVVAIEIRDDGDGFDHEAIAAGFGLIGMRERVQLVQGAFTVDSGRGSGTTIRIELPCPRQPEAQMPPAA